MLRYAGIVGASLLSACSTTGSNDLPAISGLRSAGAEWALVNREARRGRLPALYVAAMREYAREEVAREGTALRASGSSAAGIAGALIRLPPDADPALIATQVARLQQIEHALETA